MTIRSTAIYFAQQAHRHWMTRGALVGGLVPLADGNYELTYTETRDGAPYQGESYTVIMRDNGAIDASATKAANAPKAETAPEQAPADAPLFTVEYLTGSRRKRLVTVQALDESDAREQCVITTRCDFSDIQTVTPANATPLRSMSEIGARLSVLLDGMTPDDVKRQVGQSGSDINLMSRMIRVYNRAYNIAPKFDFIGVGCISFAESRLLTFQRRIANKKES